jgi:hypothetical protein
LTPWENLDLGNNKLNGSIPAYQLIWDNR